MANSILNSHYPTSSNTILTSHGWPDNTSGNALLVSHGDPYTAGGGGGSGGTLTHGSEFTITTASGFGTRAATPLVYDNFTSGTSGNDIDGSAPTYTSKSSGAWVWDTASSGVHQPKYSSASLRPNSTRNCLLQFGSASGSSWTCALKINQPMPNAGDELYFSYWWRYEDTSLANGGTQRYSRNTKPFDFWPAAEGSAPFVYIGMGNPSGDGELRFNGIDQYVPWYSGINLGAINGEWIRFEVYLKQSTANTSDGEARVYVHRSGTPSITSALHADATNCRASSGSYWENLWIGAYSSTEESDGGPGNVCWSDIRMSNVYIDTTRRRLELGDASTYGACTRREVQPSTAWSDTSITALCQKGAIPTGTAYLFVIGADGTASAGIEVDVA